MPATDRSWLTVLVMEKYTENRQKEDGTFGLSSLWRKNRQNVKLQVLVRELSSIARNINIEYRQKDPFKEHEIREKLLRLDLEEDDTVKFLQDLISCFESAYDDQSFLLRTTDLEERHLQDLANALIYLYVIPNLLLRCKNTASDGEKVQTLANVTEIINWQENCFFCKWFQFASHEHLKSMAQSLFDDSEETRSIMANFIASLDRSPNRELSELRKDCRKHVPRAFGQIFQHNLAAGVIPLPNGPKPDFDIDKSRNSNIECAVTRNPYFVELK